MEMPRNLFTHALVAGQSQLGLWITLSSPFAAEVTAPSGFDWVLIDMEHSPNDYFSVLGQLQAYAPTRTTPIVRVEWNDPVAVKRLLDLGASGLLFPMIQNVEEAEKAVASTRYPPRGTRGFSGASRATKFGRITDYATQVERETTVLLQVETAAAVDRAEEIGAVDGVHGIFFGPGDIAADMGKVGKPMDEDVWSLIRPAAEKLMAQGVPVGTLVQDPAFAADLLREGFSFVACGSDAVLLARAADGLLADMKDRTGQ
ncbi:4-hydroxy-2-oxo-heptane-1,7-dioate aldolase [Sulfitobacter alexandrii]|uniref:4-hydroxy-2-oxo-heptane-1,7-dioate aldolase n=1 Tax=Sulfitobacter alexandrii TaxID=1917485 RepID=A0A1J0WH94_9RHOB|nr:HpcH/HpaI aldolase/citrate lyase family protein [Sulfitobacter alexandrii]APE43502.1 4-hydroxy-2-oxo-heptane-1,7-dioate aldolase [Sulfitobacter alexandrii]